MTQKEKQLLLQDLCARLPYDTTVYVAVNTANGLEWLWEKLTKRLLIQIEEEDAWEYIKPYLRPLSSMTEEELKEFRACHCVYDLHPDFQPIMCTIMNERNMFDWLNKNMFDYRGLIPKGLAIEVTENNNPYK